MKFDHAVVARGAVTLTATVSLVACAGGRMPPAAVAMTPVAKRSLTLDAANARWQGAKCELLMPVDVKKGADAEGWHHSGRILVAAPGKRKGFYLHVNVSQPETLGMFYSGKSVQPGVTAVSGGWKLQKPEEGKGPYLEVQSDRAPAKARVEFQAMGSFSSSGFPLDRLGEIEQYVRLNLFKVTAAADEELVDVPRQ